MTLAKIVLIPKYYMSRRLKLIINATKLIFPLLCFITNDLDLNNNIDKGKFVCCD